MTDTTTFPGGSKTRVTRAGSNVRGGTATQEDLKIIEEWRAAHRGVLNTFQAILRNRTKGTNARRQYLTSCNVFPACS
jgi:putative GTP pyrophosphokinase